VDDGLSVAPQYRWWEDDAGHALRFGCLLRLEVCRARVSQYVLKAGGCVTTGGARGIIVDVASRES
jgi:hypothetical protein